MTEIDSEDDTLEASMLTTLDSHMCTKSCGDSTLHDHLRMSVDQPNDKFEVNIIVLTQLYLIPI